MGLRLFTDHCISNFIIHELLKAGHEVFKLKDYIPVESSDSTVISTAQALDSILVSLKFLRRLAEDILPTLSL
jgi:hypothetical protein